MQNKSIIHLHTQKTANPSSSGPRCRIMSVILKMFEMISDSSNDIIAEIPHIMKSIYSNLEQFRYFIDKSIKIPFRIIFLFPNFLTSISHSRQQLRIII